MNKLFEKYDGQHNPGRKEAKLKENTILKVSIYVECIEPIGNQHF